MDARVINIDPEILGGTPVFFEYTGTNQKSFQLFRNRRLY